ncbi:MAG: pantoate--beta-alanine ligase [Candidatus Omnitrophota bacterium]
MKIIAEPDKMRVYSKIIRKEGRTIGFVPTMGYLHEGHVSLMKAAKKQNDLLVASIFVNPKQFGPDEDFGKYPRDMARDEEIAQNAGVDVLFCPSGEDMYPEGYSTYVNVEGLTDGLCGRSRPGHFRGVTTVVMKLLELIRPDMLYLGQKDAQQAAVITRMVRDLNVDVMVKVLPIVREPDGLAMSSRNMYLGPDERREAAVLRESLAKAEEMFAGGEMDSKKILRNMSEMISARSAADIDYIKIVDAESLRDVERINGPALVALAVRIGKTRLIDNTILDGGDV